MMIDFRCSARSDSGGRCQLLAGHEAAHALVHDDPQQSGVRMLCRWKPGELARLIPVGADPSALCLPWAPGMPVTAHVELALVAIPAGPRAVRPVTFIGRGPAFRPVRSA